VYVDSFLTSGTGTILVGSYLDPKFGAIAAKSFTQIGLPLTTVTIPDGSVYDSIEIILKLNKNYYGDTSQLYTISINQLIDPISLPINHNYFSNKDSRPYNSVPLGSKQFLYTPTSMDTISIRLTQSVGQDLFNKFIAGADQIQDNPRFINYFKGLAIVGASNDSLIANFTDKVIMRMHYHTAGTGVNDANVDFTTDNNYSTPFESNQFNNITINRTSPIISPIASLSGSNRELLSSQTGGAGFGQYVTGSMVKISFPYLRNLLQLNNFVKIVKAELIIKPLNNSFTINNPLPPYLRLATTDQNNQIGEDVYGYNSGGVYAIQYGNLIIDGLYGVETSYIYDLTGYLQDQIAISANNKNGLLVLPPNQTKLFNRILIGDNLQAKESKTLVKIYYASVK
ncbi:MAG: DUF4270 family protein, partial [Sphingobacteriales bacterium]|nr:DUF4270 family protein [Sphingobacteriales bacterium]